jgi:hypothetical protein
MDARELGLSGGKMAYPADDRHGTQNAHQKTNRMAIQTAAIPAVSHGRGFVRGRGGLATRGTPPCYRAPGTCQRKAKFGSWTP